MRLGEAMEQCGIEKSAIARELCVCEAELERWQDEKTAPDIWRARRLCAMMGLQMDDIFFASKDT